jgi:hypothetical protein
MATNVRKPGFGTSSGFSNALGFFCPLINNQPCTFFFDDMDPKPPPIPASVPAMTLSYEVRRIDLFSTWFTIFLRNRVMAGLVIVPFGFILLTQFLSLRNMNLSPLTAVFVSGFTAGSYALGFLAIQAVVAGLMLLPQKRDRGVLGAHVLEITDEGLVESTEVNRGLHKWAGIYKIISGPCYLYIYTGRFAFFLVPRARCDPTHLNFFEKELQRRVAESAG